MSQVTIGAKRETLPARSGLYIEFLGGEENGRRVPLVYTKTILGRKNGDVLVRDIRVSSSHLTIEYRHGRLRAVDLGSSNGSFVDGKKISNLGIELGQVVQVGQTSFCVKQDVEVAEKLLSSRHTRLFAQSGGLSGLLDREFIQMDTSTAVATEAISKPAKPEERLVRLRIIAGQDKGKKYKIKKPKISIGRAACDIILKDSDVSRKHALLELEEGGQVVLRDLASSNGTYVNEVRVVSCVVQQEDRIQLGKTVIVFESAEAEGP